MPGRLSNMRPRPPRTRARRTRHYRPTRGVSNPIVRFSTNRYMMARNIKNVEYPYILTAQGNTIVQGAGATNNAYGFRLTDIPNIAEYTSLYDQYKFMKVQFIMMPLNQQPADLLGPTGTNGDLLMGVVDKDDATALTGPNDYFEYSSVKYQQAYSGRKIMWSFVPHAKSLAVSAAGSDYVLIPQNAWKDCSGSDINHYGLKIRVPAYSDATHFQQWFVIVKYWVVFRNTR